MKKRYGILLTGVYLLLSFSSLQAARQLFVAVDGKDTHEGTRHRPLQTIGMALQKIEQENWTGEIEILLRGGTYYIDRTLRIAPGESVDRLVLKAWQQEKVIISGGKRLPLKSIKKITDPEILARVQPSVRAEIRELDLRSLGITIHGLRPSGFGRPSEAAWTELFINGQPLHIARWPNDSMVLIGKIEEPGNGERQSDVPYPVFHYQESRPAAWARARECWIGGYFAHGYADDMIPVSRIDTLRKTIHAALHTVYGFMSGASWRRWYALNLPEELDLPGEYVLDTLKGKIYFYPPKGQIKNMDVTILDLPLLAVENCENVSVEGIFFEHGRYIGLYLENTRNVCIRNCTVRNMGGVGVSMGKGSLTPDKKTLCPHAAETGGIAASGVIGDLLGKVYQDVLFNRQAGFNNGVINCYIYNTGAGGVSLGGGDRASLTPAGNYVENCRIHDFNRVEKSYRPGIWMDGVGNRISRCDIYNAPSMAILFHGNNHVIELCRITNVCNEVDDQGAIYYGRDPSEQGNVIRYCYFRELSPRHRVTATYHDDGACGTNVYGNIYYKAGSLPVLIGGGCDNRYTHNIFIESPVAIHVDNRLQNWAAPMIASGGIFRQRLGVVKHTEPPYSLAYPLLAGYWDENPALPKRNLVRGNLFYKIEKMVRGRTEWLEMENNWETADDPGFVNPADPLKGFRPDAPLFRHIPDFPVLPYGQMGCDLPEKQSALKTDE